MTGMDGVTDMGWDERCDIFFEIVEAVGFKMRGYYTLYQLYDLFKLMASGFCRDVIFFTKFWFPHLYLTVLFHKMILMRKTMTKSLTNVCCMNFISIVSTVFAFIMFNTVYGNICSCEIFFGFAGDEYIRKLKPKKV